ncbi:MAG: sugar transferase [Acidobacteriota bacterium]
MCDLSRPATSNWSSRRPRSGTTSKGNGKDGGAFQSVLQLERQRAERSGNPLSLVLFDLEGVNGVQQRSRTTLRELLQERTRSTDTVGWLDRHRLGAVLPYTPYRGALNLAQDVCAQCGLEIPFRVLTYPSDPPGGTGPSSRQDQTRLSSEPTPETPRTSASADEVKRGNPRDPVDARNRDEWPFWPLHPIPFWKRWIDIAGSLVGLILLSPILALIASAIKVTSPGPVFYEQDRIGYGGKPFRLIKFRTMHAAADQNQHRRYVRELISSGGSLAKLDGKDDPRIFPLGGFLRSSCLDELPQLFNVLRGEMSLVGPRPCLPYEAELFRLWHQRRFDSVPGMTGLWQINGKNATTFAEMIRLDIRYEKNRSFWVDLHILAKTLPAILTHGN